MVLAALVDNGEPGTDIIMLLVVAEAAGTRVVATVATVVEAVADTLAAVALEALAAETHEMAAAMDSRL